MVALALVWSTAAVVGGCEGAGGGPPITDDPGAAAVVVTEVAIEPVEPALRRLTRSQYDNAVQDLLGSGAPLPPALEPDAVIAGSQAVGSSVAAVSPWGVEKYESAAYALAMWALGPAHRGNLVTCEPAGLLDAGCAEEALAMFARRAWRRPVTVAELERLVAVATEAAEELGDFYEGLAYAVAAVLQAPSFIYRVELGEDDPDLPGARRFTAWEMATRLSFFLWNSIPDATLLDAAEAGELTTGAGLAAQVDRLLASDRARESVRAFFADMLELHRLDSLSKDPDVYVHFSAELGPAAREETLRGIEHIVFDTEGDIRELMTTRRAFVDPLLAAIYDAPLPADGPAADGLYEVLLPEAGGRRGLLGQVTFLASQAHAVSSSATLRGKFVREVLLCEEVPLPPSDVDTSLPEPSTIAPTLRDRVAEHLQNEICASCHILMDPIGLGLENFDGIGRWRDTEQGALIDATGDLDGVAYEDAWGLAETLRDDPRLVSCLARRMYRFASGHVEVDGESAALAGLDAAFASSGYRVKALMRAIAISKAFRTAGEVSP